VLARAACLGALTLLGACGGLPRPFQGRPGAGAMRLLQPPPPRLDVPTPTGALLSGAGSAALASNMAEALVNQEVPAVSNQAHKGDWRLVVTADLRSGQVVPRYGVLDPTGKEVGTTEGTPVPARAWAAAAPATLQATAAGAAPKVAGLLTRIDAALRQSDPNSLLNRPARVVVKDVIGAPGDGNQSLTRQMRSALPQMGEVVQDTQEGSDFGVQGEVHMAQGAGPTTRVEIQWIVTDQKGQEQGRIVQLNEVPRGTLSNYWGDVAAVVAHEAAGGVRDVILNQSGAKRAGADQAAKQVGSGK
jgi:hypothetical protein